MRYWGRRQESFDLEAELRQSRPEPSAQLVQRLETRVRDNGRTRVGSLRVAFVGALTAVMLISVASFGGAGYAASAGEDAVASVSRIVTPGDVVKVLKRSASIDQYGPTKPKSVKKAKKAKKAKKGKGAAGRVRARTRPPFTG